MKALTSLAASVALVASTLMPVPALAEGGQGERLARLLFGIATVAIIASAIDGRQGNNNGNNRNNNNNPRPQPPPADHPRPQPPPVNHPRPQSAPSAWLLPQRCWAVYPTAQGRQSLMNANCLTRNYPLARRLPMNCAITIRTRGGFESGFDPQCLRRNGFILPPR